MTHRMTKRIMVAAGLAMLAWAGAAIDADAAVQGREIAYQVDGERFTGYLAWDDAQRGARPGVLVVHEWWGHNAYARHRAGMLADLGYTAFALDMYGSGRVADHPDDARAFMLAATSDAERIKRRFSTAMHILQAQPDVQADDIAAIGYCMGGGIVLGMARAGLPLKGVVVFHGSLGSTQPAKPGQVKGEVAVFTGDADPFAPGAAVEAFEQEMKAAGARYSITVYPGVKHSFTNPAADGFAERFGMPLGYDAAADADAWDRMKAFLARVFGAGSP